MNPINVNGNNDIELVRTTLRPEVGRELDHHSVAQRDVANPPSASESIKDVIKVSDRAATIRSLAERAGQLPEVRSERVEEFRSLIQSNSYWREATDIADALLKNV